MAFYTKASVGQAITDEYKRLKLQPEATDFWIMDHRDGKLLGPYEGQKPTSALAKNLNEFIKRRGFTKDWFFVHSKDGDMP